MSSWTLLLHSFFLLVIEIHDGILSSRFEPGNYKNCTKSGINSSLWHRSLSHAVHDDTNIFISSLKDLNWHLSWVECMEEGSHGDLHELLLHHNIILIWLCFCFTHLDRSHDKPCVDTMSVCVAFYNLLLYTTTINLTCQTDCKYTKHHKTTIYSNFFSDSADEMTDNPLANSSCHVTTPSQSMNSTWTCLFGK